MSYSPENDQENNHETAGWTAPAEFGFSADEQAVRDDAQNSLNEEQAHISSPFDDHPNEVQNFDEEHHEPKERKRRKKNPFQKRIDQLVYEKGTVEQNNAFLAQQLAEKEAFLAQQQARLQEYEQKINQKDEYANEYFETTLDTQESNLKSRLKQAKEEGDVDAEVEIIDQLADLKSTRATHEAWKIQEQVRKQQELQNEDYVPYEVNVKPPPMPKVADLEFQEWLAENQWYQNPQLKSEADSVANELSNILLFNNQGDIIGTPDFRESVTKIMKERYGVGYSDPAPSNYDEGDYYPDAYRSNMAPQRSSVAPVTRPGTTMAHNYMNQRGGERFGRALSKEEYEVARHLVSRKGNESEMDLVRRYQKAKNYPKSPLPGGSPYRLTIM